MGGSGRPLTVGCQPGCRIILETDVHEIVARIGKAPTSIVDMPLNEQTFSSAFSFAKQQLKSFLK